MFNKKYLAIWIVALLILGAGIYGLVSHYVHVRDVNTNLKQQQAEGNRIKQQKANASKNDQSSSPTQSTPSPTQTPITTPATKTPAVTLTITALDQTSTELEVRAEFNKITSQGTCTLSLTSGSQTVTRTANVQPLASVSTCQGFNVPLSNLSPGVWTATVSFSDSTSTASASKQITIH